MITNYHTFHGLEHENAGSDNNMLHMAQMNVNTGSSFYHDVEDDTYVSISELFSELFCGICTFVRDSNSGILRSTPNARMIGYNSIQSGDSSLIISATRYHIPTTSITGLVSRFGIDIVDPEIIRAEARRKARAKICENQRGINLLVSRKNCFIEVADLFEALDEKWLYVLREVKFLGEEGLDHGGLKR
jgi:hypothetical protein